MSKSMNIELFVSPLMESKARHVCSALNKPTNANRQALHVLQKLQELVDVMIRELVRDHKAAEHIGGPSEVFPSLEYPSEMIEVDCILSYENLVMHMVTLIFILANRNSRVSPFYFTSMMMKDMRSTIGSC